VSSSELRTSWKVVNPEDVEGTTLGKRAKKRLDDVKLVGSRRWRVNGNPKLGDAYGEYIITLPEGSTKYECTCYTHQSGNYRRRKMCSHVLAVVLFRKTAKGRVYLVNDVDHEQIPVVNTEPPEPKAVVVDVPAYDDAGVRRGGTAQGMAVMEALLSEAPIDVTHPALGEPPLPERFTEYRDHQWRAIVEIVNHLNNGAKVVMLSAPTGSGKTLIGESVRRLIPGSSVYSCTTKSLQDQIAGDFPYANVIKGKSNYPTYYRKDLTADDCTGTSSNGYQCDWCPGREVCPYQIAKEVASFSPLPVLNIAYYMAETSSHQGSKFINRNPVIIDEADTLEDQLMSAVEVVISARLRKTIGVYALPKKTVPSDWVQWLQLEIMPGINRRIRTLASESRTLLGVDTQKMREIKRLERLKRGIRVLLAPNPETGAAQIEDGWVMTGYEGDKDEYATIRFKPIHVAEFAHEYLWSRGNQFLLMSATLISPEQMAEDLGLRDDEWEVVHVNSTFPPENRPVIVKPVASMTMKSKDTAWPQMADAVTDIIDENPGVRILIHTVSYHLTSFLIEHIDSTTRNRDSIMSYTDAKMREGVLKRFLGRDDSVLLAPSFERGIDLPEEDCQVIVIAKVPYPYLGDKQINARMRAKGGQSWYAVQTIRSIVQMTGRGMRSRTDWCDTYILDAQFKRLYRENKRLFPKWWREALVLSQTDPKYRELVKAARKRREARNG